jgi:hypothetical protein
LCVTDEENFIYFLFHLACIMSSPAYLLIQSSSYSVREVPVSNLDLDTRYRHVVFLWFPESFQKNCNLTTPRLLPSKSFPIRHSPAIALYNLIH